MADANLPQAPSGDLNVGPEPPPRLRTMRDDLTRVKQGAPPLSSAPLASEPQLGPIESHTVAPAPMHAQTFQAVPPPPPPTAPQLPLSIEAPPDLPEPERTEEPTSPPDGFRTPENLPVAPGAEPEPPLSSPSQPDYESPSISPNQYPSWSQPKPFAPVHPEEEPSIAPSQPLPPPDIPAPSAHEDFDLLGHIEQQPHGSPQPPPEEPSLEAGAETPNLETPEQRLAYGAASMPTLPDDAPLRPEELLALEEEVAIPSEESRRLKFPFPVKLPQGKALFLIGGSVIVAILLIGIGYSLFNKNRGGNEQPPPAPPPLVTENPEPPLPEVLIPLTSTGTITIQELSSTASELHSLFAQPTDVGALRGVLLKLDDGKEKRYLTFDEMLDGLGLAMTDEIKSSLNASIYTLFTYGEADGMTRAGFVVKISDVEKTRNALAQRENQLAEDSDQLLRSLGKVSQPASSTFLSNTRRNLNIRYLNFSDPNMTLDYAIDPNRHLLILATSRASMFAAIDALP